MGTRAGGGRRSLRKAVPSGTHSESKGPGAGMNLVSGRPQEGCGRRDMKEGSGGPWVSAASRPRLARDARRSRWQELGPSGLAQIAPLGPVLSPASQLGMLRGVRPGPSALPVTGQAEPLPFPSPGPREACGFPLSNRRTPRAGDQPSGGSRLAHPGSAPQASPSPMLGSASSDLASGPTLIPCPQAACLPITSQSRTSLT